MQRGHSGDFGERFWDCYVPRCSRFKSDASSSESRNSRIFCLSNFSPSSARTARARLSEWLTAGRAANRILFTQASQLLLLLHKLWWRLPSSCFPDSNKIFDCSVFTLGVDVLSLSTYTAVAAVKQREFLTHGKQRSLKCFHLPSLRARTCNSLLCIHVLIKKTTN